MPDHIFLSVADPDRIVAHTLCHTLEEHGLSCWLAARDIPPGADWGGAIIEAIRNSRTCSC